jgi:electron transfer flavoprotein alpha subunit
MSILAVLEQRKSPEGQPAWNRMSWETLSAAQQFARELSQPLTAAVLGQGIQGLAAGLASKQMEKAYAVEHPLLENYTADAYSAALRQLLDKTGPALVLFPHTYQVRDFLPKLATAQGRVAISDVIGHKVEGSQLTLVRQLFQGKLNADVRFAAADPNFASLQAGAYRADQVAEGTATVEKFVPELSASNVRTKPLDPFRESQRAVDLGAAELIVSVGRGIKEAENIPLVQKLAEALGAELAASRPICDAGWLPMERQVGSSGQTVAPKMYVAVGISGAIQHLVGMKGARTIVAINKDPNAPIFEIADYGIVGDLFQVVPELTEAIRKIK